MLPVLKFNPYMRYFVKSLLQYYSAIYHPFAFRNIKFMERYNGLQTEKQAKCDGVIKTESGPTLRSPWVTEIYSSRLSSAEEFRR